MNLHCICRTVRLENYWVAVALLPAAFAASEAAAQSSEPVSKIGAALTFHASFDRGLDADYAAGDPLFRQAPSLSKQAEAKPGLPESGEVQSCATRDASDTHCDSRRKNLPCRSSEPPGMSRIGQTTGAAPFPFG
jgi:hypothetical protein